MLGNEGGLNLFLSLETVHFEHMIIWEGGDLKIENKVSTVIQDPSENHPSRPDILNTTPSHTDDLDTPDKSTDISVNGGDASSGKRKGGKVCN